MGGAGDPGRLRTRTVAAGARGVGRRARRAGAATVGRGDQVWRAAMSKQMPKRILVRARNNTSEMGKFRTLVDIQHGYLWIGGDPGPCFVAITGRKTLLKIAAMIRRYAR